jgi:TPR repeat protein
MTAIILSLALFGQPMAVAEESKPGEKQAISPEVLFASMLVNAEKGQPQAMFNVGMLYEQGLGVPRNLTKALEWYEKASLAGEKEANFRMGTCYEIGLGTAVDLARAVAAYEKAAEMGSAEGQRKMASMYLTGQGIAKDEGKGLALLIKAAQAGNGSAANELAAVYLHGLFGQGKDQAKAFEWFQKSADAGNLEAIKNLAVMLKDGIGRKPDPEGALRWYLIAQKGGLRAQDLDKIIADLKRQVTERKAEKIEAEATAWIEAYANRQAGENI